MASGIGRLFGDLAHRRSLARAVDPHEQNDGGILVEHPLAALGERVGDLVVEQIEHGIRVGKRLARRLIPQIFHDGGSCARAHVA